MKTKHLFSFHQEPGDSLYRALVDLAFERCASFILVVRQPDPLNPGGQAALASLAPSLIDVREATRWPGTELHCGAALLYEFELNSVTKDLLKDVARSLYMWQQPDLPEDLCFLRSDRTPWLVTIAHERDAYLELTPVEAREMLEVEPKLGDCIAAD